MDRNPFPATESLASEGEPVLIASYYAVPETRLINLDLLLCRQHFQSEEARN